MKTQLYEVSEQGATNVFHSIIGNALRSRALPSDIECCISSFCCDIIRYSVLDNLDDEEKMKDFISAKDEDFEDLKVWLKEVCGSRISKVQVSSSLADSPMAIAKYGCSAYMEKLQINQTTKILQINYRHPLMIDMKNRVEEGEAEENQKMSDLANLLLDVALIQSGFDIDNDNQQNMAQRVERIVRNGLGVSLEAPLEEEPEYANEVDEDEDEDDEDDDEEEEGELQDNDENGNYADCRRASLWPSLTIENDDAFFGFMGADSDGVGTVIFALSVSTVQRNGEHSEWLSVGAITNSQRMFGVRAQSLGRPIRLRIQNENGEEKLLTLNGTLRAVFGRKSEGLQTVNVRTVKKINGGCASVLCGDGKAIDDALCDRFRIRFRTNVVSNGFCVGFVRSEADAMDLNKHLGVRANSEHSVGICVGYNTFYLYDKENEGKELPSQLSSNVAFPVSAQEWLVEFDFVAHSLCLFLRMPKQWALAIKLEMPYSEIIPAFSLGNKNDEIEIV